METGLLKIFKQNTFLFTLSPDLGKSGAVNDKQEAAKVKNVLRKASKPPIPEVVDSTGMTDKEKSTKATAEKEKGNEVGIIWTFLGSIL